jgi:hypothetical protein
VGGNDRFLVLFECEQDRRDQIRERFANASAGLDHQMSIFLQSSRYRDGHLLLLWPKLEVLRLGKQSVLGKDSPNSFDKFSSEGIFQRYH